MLRFAAVVFAVSTPALADVTGPGGKTIDCYCTDTEGLRVELGETICLVVNGRAFMAQCDMSLNTPMWRDTGSGCVSSSLAPEHSPVQRLFQLTQPPV
ncbi:MAG: hypothetical protein AAF222_03175 [Pseudomonadota bacterium]